MDKLDQLKDIKAVEVIVIDFTFYFIFITLFIILFVVLVYFFTMRKKKRITKEQIAKKNLINLDFKIYDSKELAYKFTLYGHGCVQEYFKDEFVQIVEQLEKYKYKKLVQDIDEDLISQMQDYIKVRV